MVNYYLILSFIISLIFGLVLLLKYIKNFKLNNLFWSLGFIFMAVAYLLNFYALLTEWNPNIFKIYYFSSMFLVILLGLGTSFLLNNKFSKYFLIYSIIFSILFAIFDFTASVNMNYLLNNNLNAMPVTVVMISLLLVIPGSIILIVGAYYSAIKLRKNKNAIIYNSLIGTGALIYTITGSIALANIYIFFYTLQLVGLILMFIGFLKSINVI